MIKKNNIARKLWLAMTVLVLIVLGFYVLIQTGWLQHTYYKQQTNQLVAAGQSLAEVIAQETNPVLARNMMTNTAAAVGAHIFLVGSDGSVLEQSYAHNGMGMGMGHGFAHRGHMMMGNQDVMPDIELTEILKGQIVINRIRSEYLNTEVLSVGVPIVIDNQAAGAVLLQAPILTIDNRLRVLQYTSLYAAAAGIVLAAMLSLFLSRSLVRPILEINKAAQDMAGGQYDRQVHIKTNDEIGMLADSFNKLSGELQDKIAELERLDQTRRDFVANVSHELRTPLTIIQGFNEALLDGMAKTEEDKKRYLTNIHHEILRLRRLVDDLLDLRRLEIGQIKVQFVPVDIVKLIERVADVIKPLAREKGIAFEHNSSNVSLTVNADADRLYQVLINLLDNALRVTKRGGKITVDVQEKSDVINISVTDTGPGIDPNEIPLIWERFYKVNKSRTRKGSGTGLGLAISKKIIELHGGTIEVSSELGKGSTFSFKIPKI